MKQLHFFVTSLIVFSLFYLNSFSQSVPEILYYKFNTGTTTTPNLAVPGQGTPDAVLVNMTMGPGGQFGNGLNGNAGTGTTTYLNTGWNMNFGTSSWTISLYMKNFTTGTTYLFGNDITTSFRCFTNGAAGTNNITLRGNGITNVNVTGVIPGPSVIHFVYDSTASEIRTYVNGVFQSAVAQTPLNLNAAVPFKVGSYGTASSIPVGTLLDEFRVYSRALSATEITNSWNVELPVGGGVVKNFAMLLPTPGVNTNYVAIPHQASMIGFTNYTIEAWMKPGSTVAANTVLNKGGLSFDYQLGVSAGGVPFVRNQGSVATSVGLIIAAGVWTHLAATFDGSTVRFYKDGILASTVPLATLPGSSANEMRIGRGNADAGTGNLEEVRLWSVARTQGQIDSNRCRKYPSQFTSSTGLKALWHLDSTFVDSISGYNGTAMGVVGFDTVSFPIPGTCSPTSINPIGGIIPEKYSLSQNYPNPFNPTTRIEFAIPRGEFVELKLYDIAGKEIGTLVHGPYEAGRYIFDFNAGNLSSGIYFYTIIAGSFRETKKMLLIK
jgi:hypothetical protein